MTKTAYKPMVGNNEIDEIDEVVVAWQAYTSTITDWAKLTL